MLKTKLINLAIIIIGTFLIINLSRSVLQLYKAGDRVGEAKKELEALQKENEDLQKKLEEVQTPEFIEKMARDKLGLAKEGETVVIIAEDQTEATSDASKKENQDLPVWQKLWEIFF